MSVTLPKPEFKSCDETSLTLKSNLNLSNEIISGKHVVKLEYKLVREPWENSKSIPIIINEKNSKVDISAVLVSAIDLDPGTPYMVRFGLYEYDSNKLISYGPETVFDTAPVDCGPKRKKCVIS